MLNLVCLTTIFVVVVSGQDQADQPPWLPQQGDANNTHFWERHQELLQQTNDHASDIKAIFIGSSAEEGWINPYFGGPLWNCFYANPWSTYNYGVGGDTTSQVLWRIQNGELDGLNKLKFMVTSSGPAINCLQRNQSLSAADVVEGWKAYSVALLQKFPCLPLIIYGFPVFEAGLPDVDHFNKTVDKAQFVAKVTQINAAMKAVVNEFFGDENHFIDLTANFTDSSGSQLTQLFADDHLHPNTAGYGIWHQYVAPPLTTVVNDPGVYIGYCQGATPSAS